MSSERDLSWLRCAGFVLRGDVAANADAPPRPTRIVSLSSCVADGLPLASWLVDPATSVEEKRRIADQPGLDDTRIAACRSWAVRALGNEQLRWPDVFTHLESAREFARLLPAETRVALLGGGLHPDDAERHRNESSSRCASPGLAYLDMPPGGRLLGWDVTSADGGGQIAAHSFRCTHLEEWLARTVGAALNDFGLLEDVDRARHAAARLCDDDGPGEPEPYFAVAVVEFPLQRTSART